MVEAEGETEIVLVPSELFSRWVDEYPEWRRFVFRLYSKRLEVMLTIVEEVAFHHVDARIAAYLVAAAGGRAATVPGTHQMIASEVGTSREVVSRILRDFEASGLITTERGRIKILEHKRLGEHAAQLRVS
jgi:CRP/FNR family transcriptional regulator